MRKILAIMFLIAVGIAVTLSGCTNPLEPAATPTPAPTSTPVPTPTPMPTAQVTLKPSPPVVIYNQVAVIELGTFNYLNGTLVSGTKLDITVTSDNPIDFLLLNESNFLIYKESVTNLTPINFEGYIIENIVTNVSETFTVPASGKYFLIMDNTGALDPTWAPIYDATVKVVVTATQ